VSSAKAENLGTELAKLTDPQRRAASERFRVIWPFLEGGVPLKRLAEKHGKSVRTLRYWVALYRKGDILALAPKPRSDRGKRRMRDELKALAEALWLREPRRPVSSIHRQVAREAQSPGASAPKLLLRNGELVIGVPQEDQAKDGIRVFGGAEVRVCP
jgi:putative transposase